MCGIIGVVARQGDRVDQEECRRGRDLLQHRGPDDHGEWTDARQAVFLGHRRLSIIDLSTASHQPMTNDRWAIVFNGEIYNFASLRRELSSKGVTFRSSGDTEVVLECLTTWGEEAVHRFRGMFAFVAWDIREQRLIAARDHLGIKPLYYSMFQETLAIASESKSFHAFRGFSPELDVSALPEYLHFRSLTGERTLLANVRQVPPGSIMSFRAGDRQPTVRQFWDVRHVVDEAAVPDGSVESLREMLIESVRGHLIADVPVGTQFSGGVDSSLVAAVAIKELGADLSGYYCSVDGAEFDETPFASDVARHLSMRLKTVSLVEADLLGGLLDRLTWHMDEPIAHPNSLGIFKISELAKGQVKVLLSGESADEFFAGYTWYRHLLHAQTMRGLPHPVVRGLAALGSLSRRTAPMAQRALLARSQSLEERVIQSTRFVGPEGARVLRPEVLRGTRPQEYRREILDSIDPSLDWLRRSQLYDIMTYLPPLFIRQDKMSMAASIENRVPLAIPEICRWAVNAPSSVKVGWIDQKQVLKQALVRYVPRRLVYRKKWGFAIPLVRWLTSSKGRDRLRAALLERFPSSELFDRSELIRLVDDPAPSRAQVELLWVLLSYATWARIFLGDGHRAFAGIRE